MCCISIVISLFNKSSYVERTIKSVLNQTYQDFELIIVDDGSTDDSVEKVLKITDPRINLIKQKNSGVSAARNKGIRTAKAELIAFLDADDEWDENFLQEVMNLKNKYKDAEAFSLSYKMRTDNGQITNIDFDCIPNGPWDGIIENYFKCCIQNDLIHSSAIAVSKKVFYDIGFFSEGVQAQEDLDMWARIAFNYKIAFSNKSNAIYDIGITNSLSNVRVERDAPIFKDTKKFIDKYNTNNIDLFYFNEYVALHKISNIYYYLNAFKSKDKCRKLLVETRNTKLFKKAWMKVFIIYILPEFIYKIRKKYTYH